MANAVEVSAELRLVLIEMEIPIWNVLVEQVDQSPNEQQIYCMRSGHASIYQSIDVLLKEE